MKCDFCSLIYVNPRPVDELITEAVKTGVHREVEGGKSVVVRRVPSNVKHYRSILAEMFADIWEKNRPVSWLDVGAGYGELIEAVSGLAPEGSRVSGLEPMKPKALAARKRGLDVQEKYLSEVGETWEIISLINVFSHLPDFRSFLKDLARVLQKGGDFLLETGNIADLDTPREVPSELNLPDHLVFAGEKQIRQYLSEAGFEIVAIKRIRKDTMGRFFKNIIKKMLRRNVPVALPYTSRYRSLIIRARWRADLADHTGGALEGR